MPDNVQSSGQSTPPLVDVTDGRAVVRLNRPREHNRLEPADLAVLRETFDRIDAEPSVRVLVLTGTGKSFSSGFHIGALADRLAGKAAPEQDRDAFERMVDRLETLRVPTIAALNGSVYGGATDLALACDFRIGVEGMRLLMPAARLGIVYYAVAGLKRAINETAAGALDRNALAAIRAACAASADHAEGVRAWTEKRAPVFVGR